MIVINISQEIELVQDYDTLDFVFMVATKLTKFLRLKFNNDT